MLSSSSSKKRGNEETVFGFAASAGGAQSKKQKKAEKEAMQTLQNVNIQKIMTSKGPIVQCVLLKADGSTEELDVDMTPSLKRCQEILGGELTFLGQWEDIQVILLVSKDQSGQRLSVNKHKLQPPFDEAVAYGDILLTRSDDDGEAAHFPLSEYMTFKDQVISKWVPPSDAIEDEEDESEGGEEESEEEDSEDGEEDDDEVEEMDEEEALAIFLPRLIEAFKEENKRDPTAEEIEGFKEQILEGDDGDMFEAVLPQLIKDFKDETGRDPTEEEIEYLKEQVMEGLGDDEEEDSEDDQSGDGLELEAVMEQLVPKLVASFVEQNNREPTEAELKVLKDRLEANLLAQMEGGINEGDDDEIEGDESGEEDDEEDGAAYAQINQQKGF